MSFRSKIPIPVCRNGVVKETTSSLADVTVNGATAMSASFKMEIKNNQPSNLPEDFCHSNRMLPRPSGHVSAYQIPSLCQQTAIILDCELQEIGQFSILHCS